MATVYHAPEMPHPAWSTVRDACARIVAKVPGKLMAPPPDGAPVCGSDSAGHCIGNGTAVRSNGPAEGFVDAADVSVPGVYPGAPAGRCRTGHGGRPMQISIKPIRPRPSLKTHSSHPRMAAIARPHSVPLRRRSQIPGSRGLVLVVCLQPSKHPWKPLRPYGSSASTRSRGLVESRSAIFELPDSDDSRA
jgi:hypothetical protein